MELTPPPVDEIRDLLKLLYQFYIKGLREKPFRTPPKSPSNNNDPKDAGQSELTHTPKEAGKTQLTRKKKHWLAAIFIEVLAFALLFFEIRSKSAGASLPSLLAPLARVLSVSNNLLIAITVVALVLVPVIFFSVKVPVHEPDVLFARLLRSKVKSKYPISGRVIADLLSDRRFEDIFDRAVELTLPLPGDEAAWNGAALGRLRDALQEDPRFVQLYADHVRKPLPQKAEEVDPAIGEYFGYTARKLLFENILDDPDFLYLYDDVVHRRNALARLLSKIDWEKAKGIFGKLEEKKANPKGSDPLGIVNLIVLFVIAWAAFFGRFFGGSSSQSGTDAKCQDEACAKVIAELPKVIRAAVQPDRQASVPIVHVNVQPPSITFPPVEVKGPAVTLQPPKHDTPAEAGTAASPRVEVNLAPNQYSSNDGIDQPKLEVNQKRPQEPDDTFVIFENKDAQHLTLRKRGSNEEGVMCSFSATLAKWPPRYPVEIRLEKTGSDQCMLRKEFTAFAEPQPTYSGSLGAFLNVEAEYKRTPFLIWKTRKNDRLVVRVHQQEQP